MPMRETADQSIVTANLMCPFLLHYEMPPLPRRIPLQEGAFSSINTAEPQDE